MTKNRLLVVMLSCMIGVVYADNPLSESRENRRYSTQKRQHTTKGSQAVDGQDNREASTYSTQQHRNVRPQQQDKQDNQSMEAEVSVKWSYQQNRQGNQ